MITEFDILKNIPKLYKYLVDNKVLKQYIIGLNDPDISDTPIEVKWYDEILKDKHSALTHCFSWSSYEHKYHDGIDWPNLHYWYSTQYRELKEAKLKLNCLKII